MEHADPTCWLQDTYRDERRLRNLPHITQPEASIIDAESKLFITILLDSDSEI
jgi:hypothetical protein